MKHSCRHFAAIFSLPLVLFWFALADARADTLTFIPSGSRAITF
jgi:hypothetical protein